MSTETIRFEVIDTLRDVSPEEWDPLFADFPFFQYRFLRALEETGCAVPDTGWLPQFILGRGHEDELLAALPLYLKGHSMGEFVYDWAWADAAQRMGIRYYPKAIVAAPFTPATSPRLATRPGLADASARELRHQLALAALRVGQSSDLSGVHVLFCDDQDAEALKSAGYFMRRHHQYHWKNHGYETFDDFLEPFKSKRRREIRRQRRRLSEEGVRVEVFAEEELTSELRDFAWRCYVDTIDKYPWGRRYLTVEFYEAIFDQMRDVIRLFVAFDEDGTRLASALAFLGGDTLYGRYWGCIEEVSYMHFETCLYAPIEYAIRHGIQKIEPGQGGEHKFTRGFEATITQSAHWVSDPRLDVALRRHTAREEDVVVTEVEQMNLHSAFQIPESDKIQTPDLNEGNDETS